MDRILKAEHLKMKRTIGKRLIILAPVITIVLSVLAGTYFYSCAYNFWYAFFYPSVTAIICIQIQAKEEKKLGFQNIYMAPLELRLMWRGKVLLAAGYAFASSMVLSILVALITSGLGIRTETGMMSLLLAGILIFLTCSYQVPVYMYLAQKTPFLIPLLLSIFFMALGIGFAKKSYWWAVPFAWCDRLMCSVLHILPNGLFLDGENAYLSVSWGSIAILCAAAVVLFAAVLWITEILFLREEKKR